MHDVRLAFRSLRSSPIVSLLAVISLALGIGANTAIFSLIDGLLLRPLPVRDPSSLVLVSDTSAPGIRSYGYFFWDQFRQRANFFDGLLAWSPDDFALTTRGERQAVQGAWVSSAFFETLGVTPWLGRMPSAATNTAEDTTANTAGSGAANTAGSRAESTAENTAIAISYGFWQRHFGGAEDAIGRTLALNDVTFTIVGVTPPSFVGTEVARAFDVMVPVAVEPLMRGADSAVAGGSCCLNLTIMGRLRAGQTLAAATAALRGIQPQIREATLPPVGRWRPQDRDRYLRDPFTLTPGTTGNSRLRLRYERPLLTLMVVVLLVLLIACANIANLLFARAVARQHEWHVRVALGASRWQLVRPLFTESALIAIAGAALGVLLATWSSQLLLRLIATSTTPLMLDVSLDRTVLIFTIAATAFVTLLAGIAPALRMMRSASRVGISASASATATDTLRTHTGLGIPGGILVAQVALSLVLLVAAMMFVRTFVSLVRLPLGFDRDRVLMVTLNAERVRIVPEERPALFERTRDAVRAVRGVADAAISFITPVSGPVLLRPIDAADGAPITLPERERMSAVNLVSPGWFDTFGTRILTGRDFSDRDGASAPAVVIVNQRFVRKLLHGGNPIGCTPSIGIVGPNAGSAEVIGVVADAVYASLREPMPPTMYFPLSQMRKLFLASPTLSVRSGQGMPQQLMHSVAAAVGEVNPDLAISFRPLADQVDASIAQERVIALLSGFFGALAVLLAALGLFGVTLHSVVRRQREIGIRIALGAAPARVMRLVLARVAVLIGVGVVVGVAVSIWASPLVGSLLYGLGPRDPGTFIAAASVLSMVGLLAGWLPARRALRVNPASILRSE